MTRPRRSGTGSAWARHAWRIFRGWPVLIQVVGWIVAFWLLIPIRIWHTAWHWSIKVTLTALLAILLIGIINSPRGDSTNKQSGLLVNANTTAAARGTTSATAMEAIISPTAVESSAPAANATSTDVSAPSSPSETPMPSTQAAEAGTQVALLDDAVLGGPLSRLIVILGRPNEADTTDGLVSFGRCPPNNVQKFVYQYGTLIDHGRVLSITKQTCPNVSTETHARAEAEARRFFPPDTVGGSTFTVSATGDSAKKFTSSLLGRVFPAAVFRDCDGQRIPPGTFALIFHDHGDGADWDLIASTC